MPRRRVASAINRLASLPTEIFEQVMRHVLGVFTRRLYYRRRYDQLAFIDPRQPGNMRWLMEMYPDYVRRHL